MDIILIGRAAESGTLEYVDSRRDELAGKYSVRYLSQGIGRLTAEFADDECMRVLTKAGCDVFIVGRRGLAPALWALGQTLSCGLRVCAELIPISQFAVEMAELRDENPLYTGSLGCVLACCESGFELAEKLSRQGYPATVIGYTTDDNIRGLNNHGTLTFLTPDEA